MDAIKEALEPILALLAKVEDGAASKAGHGRGVFAADGKGTLRDVIVPVDFLRRVRDEIAKA